MRTDRIIIGCIILIAMIGGVFAQELTATVEDVNIRVSQDAAVYSSDVGSITVNTVIDDVKFSPDKVEKADKKIKFSSGEKAFIIFDNPDIQQEYTTNGKALEDVVILKKPKRLSYRIAGGSLSMHDGGIRISSGNDEDGYLYMKPATGLDSNGQGINMTYEIAGDRVNVIVPETGNAGNSISYPIVLDPIIEPRYSLVLLLHNNLEQADAFSTSTPRDSSKYGHMPAFLGPAAADYNLNVTAPPFGNASAFLRPRANITVPDSDLFNFGANNFTICGVINWTGAVGDVSIFNQTPSAGTAYQRFGITSGGGALVWSSNNGASGELATYTFAGGFVPVVNKPYTFCAIKNGTVLNLTMNNTAVGTGTSSLITNANLAAPVVVGMNATTTGSSLTVDELRVWNGWAAPIGSSLLNSEWPLYSNTSVSGPNLGYADDNSTTSLLHFDGADGSTFFRDEVANRTWTITFGTSNIRNVSAKFSPAGYNATGNAVISANAGSVWDFGSADWTIEGWMKFPIATPSNSTYLSYSTDAVKGYSMYCIGTACVINSNQSGSYTADLVGYTTFANDVYSHVVFTKNGTALMIFKDGKIIGQTTISAGSKFNSAGNFLIIVNNGTLDEYRVSKGIARYTANFTPQSTPFGMTVPSFTANKTASGTAPFVVQFNSTTLDDQWTRNAWFWTFGDGGTSTEQNPVHTFASTGTLNTTLQTFNNNMTSVSSAQTIVIGAPVLVVSNSPSSANVGVNTTIAISLSNTSPISAWFFDFGDGTTTTDPPTYVSGSGTSTVWAKNKVFNSYNEVTINVSATNSYGTGYGTTVHSTAVNQNQQQTWYSPKQISFKLVDRNQQAVVGATMYPTVTEASLPGGLSNASQILISMYGVPQDVAPLVVSNITNMRGTSGDDGKVTFTMYSSLQYNLTMVDAAGHYYYKIIYPLENQYIITLPQTGTYLMPQDRNNTYFEYANRTLEFSEPNASYMTLGVNYSDPYGLTTKLDYYVYVPTNGSYINWTNLTVTGSGAVLANKTYENIRGAQYQWGYIAERADNNIAASQGVTCKGPAGVLVSLGLEEVMPIATALSFYTWISIGMCFLVVTMASTRTYRFFTILVPVLAAVFLYFGWFTLPSNTSLPLTLISAAGLLGGAIYIKETNREKFGSGGPGLTLLNLVLFMMLLQGVGGVISASHIFPGPGNIVVSQQYANVDLSEQLVKLSDTSGWTTSTVASGLAVLEMGIGVVKIFMSMILGIVAFSYVIYSIFPFLVGNQVAFAIIGLFQLIIWALYVWFLVTMFWKPGIDSGWI